MQTVQQQVDPAPSPGLWSLFLIWSTIGLQSFGGGATTTLLIQREFVEKRQWLTMEDFTHLWNLCVLAPGINLLAITTLIGRRFGGIRGIFVSLLGMLLPSALCTCLIAAGFKLIENAPAMQSILQGIVPATAAIMLLVGIKFAQPQIRLARQDGIAGIVLSILFVLACLVALLIFQLPAAFVLPGAGVLGALIFTYVLRSQSGKDHKQRD